MPKAGRHALLAALVCCRHEAVVCVADIGKKRELGLNIFSIGTAVLLIADNYLLRVYCIRKDLY